jgi:hypothetical protein
MGNIDVDVSLILKTGRNEIEFEGMIWFELAQDSVHWRAVVNTVMNLLRLPRMTRNFLTS